MQKDLEAKALFDGEQNERIRIARDLHDSVGQMLALLKFNLSSQYNLKEDLLNLVDKTITEVRSISHNLIPEELNFGIIPALENLCFKVNSSRITKMQIHYKEEIKVNNFNKQFEISIYRIVQEITTNILKHANASLINVSLKEIKKTLIINIWDNGKGINTQPLTNSLGIGWKNINARVHMMDGIIKVNSEQLKGTKIEIKLPINA